MAAGHEPSAESANETTQPSKKESPLYLRLYFQRHLTDLVRMVGHGLPEAEGREKIQPLIAQYGDAKMRAAVAEIVEIDYSQKPPIARLKERVRTLAKALLGPPPSATASAVDTSAAPPAAVSQETDQSTSPDESADQVETPVKAPRSSVIPRFLDFLRQGGRTFNLAEDAKREWASEESAMAVLDVIVSDANGSWLVAIRRGLRPDERAALRRLAALYGRDFRPARVWPVTGDKGWVWKRYPVANNDNGDLPQDERGETL